MKTKEMETVLRAFIGTNVKSIGIKIQINFSFFRKRIVEEQFENISRISLKQYKNNRRTI